MKRRYKKGDWFRVPLGARSDALGIITQACRSRLFGYFFAAPEGEIANAALKRLRPQDACARFLFGGDPIDLLRWPLLATSLDFDESRWPFPAFAHRGAFGRAWIIREFDPETLQVVAQRTIERDAAQDLPGAHFVRVTEAEDLLARAVDGTATPAPSVICECRVPIEASSLEPLAGGGRVQVSQALSRTDAAALARSLTHPSTELCVHDVYGVPFDCRVLREWPALRALALDTGNLSHVEAIGALEQLELLQIHAGALNGLISNSARELRVAGDGSIVDVRTWPALESLVLENAAFSSANVPRTLKSLVLRHCNYDLSDIAALRCLERLELRGGALEDIAPVAGTSLRALTLHGVRGLRDFGALASAPALRLVRLEAMPQIRPADLAVLARCERLQVRADSGNRTLDREIQRVFVRERTRP